MRAALATVLAVAGGAVPLAAQDTPAVIPGGVQLVRVDVVVTDGKGRRVPDLRADEFTIEEDGRPRTVAALRYVTTTAAPPPASAPAPEPAAAAPASLEQPFSTAAEPRSMAIVVDDPSFSDESRVRTPRVIRHLVDTLATPDTPILILRTGGGPNVGQDFTTDRHQLAAVVARLRPSARDEQGEPVRAVELSLRTLGIVQQLVEDLAERPGRKALLFFTEGLALRAQKFKDDSAEDRVLHALRRLTDTANLAGVTISTIDPAGLRSGRFSASTVFDQGPGIDSAALSEKLSTAPARAASTRRELQEGPERLSSETGGLSLFGNDLAGGVERLWNDQDGYYLIGYEPAAGSVPLPGADAVEHEITVRVTRKGLKVRSRRVYYARAAEPGPAAP
jgi:VWFA-related protein